MRRHDQGQADRPALCVLRHRKFPGNHPHASLDPFDRNRRVADPQVMLRLPRAGEERVARFHHDTLAIQARRQFRCVGSLRCADPKGRPALCRDRPQGGCVLRQRGAQPLRPRAIGHVQAPHEGLLMPVGDEAGRNLLVVGGHMPHHQLTQRAQLADQLGRRYHIAKTQPVGQGLGEAADVNHT